VGWGGLSLGRWAVADSGGLWNWGLGLLSTRGGGDAWEVPWVLGVCDRLHGLVLGKEGREELFTEPAKN